ncbi:hypothetical protein, partial [Actinosynnema sp.]|uniref:hypothetical protein n=1 Tax=Actinosynnema sp. TaxID=1872144 RepID=UPI003F843DBE
MSPTQQKNGTVGVLLPFPDTSVPTGHEAEAPTSTAGAVTGKPGAASSAAEATAPMLDGELVTEAEYRRSYARRLVESAVSRLPTQWQTAESARQAGTELASRVALLPV